jgi:ribosomal protein S18 acetylase RimI-like enzyme
MHLRNVTDDDYPPIIRVIDEWWGGRQMADMLPRLFFQHFQQTSFVIEHGGQVIAFLIGFISPSIPDLGYIHFVGVHPDYRREGLGERLYRHFFEVVKGQGCTRVNCVTAPVNKGSIAFHTRLGFVPKPSEVVVDGVPVQVDYDGRGGDRVVFFKHLD